jgi:hypothetical protein
MQFGPQVSLTWTDNANDETGFVVERSDNGGGFVQIATPAADAINSLDTTVQPGHTYVYRVYAVSGAGPSGYSNEATAVIPLPPLAPTNLVLTVQGSLTTGPRIRVVFRDNQNGGNPETGFRVYRSDNGGAFNLLTTLPPRAGVGNVPAYFDYAVTGGNTYSYYVVTVRGVTPSAPSNTAIASVPPGPAAPSNFLATTQVTGGGTTARVNMIWTDNSNNESRFVIQRATDPNFTTNLFTSNRGANTTAWSNGNLPRGTTFYYRIRSENPYGVSAWVNLTPFPIVTP